MRSTSRARRLEEHVDVAGEHLVGRNRRTRHTVAWSVDAAAGVAEAAQQLEHVPLADAPRAGDADVELGPDPRPLPAENARRAAQRRGLASLDIELERVKRRIAKLLVERDRRDDDA